MMLRSGSRHRIALVATLAISLAAGALTRAASLRQSATFDKIILVSGGARGVAHGRWDMVTDQPPLMMWLYGWAVMSSEPELPSEERTWGFNQRWDYARALFFEGSNDPEVLLPRPRFTVISATNLQGLCLQGCDPFASYREREPYRVLGHALLVFDEHAEG